MGNTGHRKTGLLPLGLALGLLLAAVFPCTVEATYAGPSDSPDHILTYTTGALTWDSATGIDPNGSARLELFSQSYQNVQSQNEEKVVAPGTENRSVVRLKNDVSHPIQYVAVMYRIQEEPDLPVAPVLAGAGFAETEDYPLPDGITEDQVVRAVTGTVPGGQLQDFELLWSWNYYESDQRDQVDTALGNRAAWFTPDEVTAGLYVVVVEDDGPPPTDPEDPEGPEEPEDPGDPEDPAPPLDPVEKKEPKPTYRLPEVPNTGADRSTPLKLTLAVLSMAAALRLLSGGRGDRE